MCQSSCSAFLEDTQEWQGVWSLLTMVPICPPLRLSALLLRSMCDVTRSHHAQVSPHHPAFPGYSCSVFRVRLKHTLLLPRAQPRWSWSSSFVPRYPFPHEVAALVASCSCCHHHVRLSPPLDQRWFEGREHAFLTSAFFKAGTN